MMWGVNFRSARECVDQIDQNGNKAHVDFRDLENVYDRLNRETLWQVPRMHDVGGKPLNGACIVTFQPL